MLVKSNPHIAHLTARYHTANPPNKTLTAGIDHVVMAFAKTTLFNSATLGDYVPFEDISTVRSRFDENTKLMIAIGGWGDTAGFSEGAATNESRRLFAKNVVALCDKFGFDGVDLDWEYPGGNGQDYKQVPNSKKTSEIETFPLLLAEVRRALGSNRLLSIASPGKIGDMIAYRPENAMSIWKSVDWVNVMTYDLMNRRNDVTVHHTDVKGSLETIDYYINTLHLDVAKINLGIAMYAKYFIVDSSKPCQTGLGCATVQMESADGTDLGKSGAVTFEAQNWRHSDDFKEEPGQNGNIVYPDIILRMGTTDEAAGGQYYYDRERSKFWTWDTPKLIERKFSEIISARGLGGVMVWSLCQDSLDFSHIATIQKSIPKFNI